ncbi:MAG TPA: DMT family transporter [Syntrophales bacterium]|nr:DMT family transporter [Syntrophales bacterium]
MDIQTRAYGYALLSVALWSTVASAFKITLRRLPFDVMLLFAAFFSSLLLFAVLNLQGKLPLLVKMGRREWLRSSLLGFLNPFLYYLILFKAYDLLPAQEAQALNYTWPITVVILSSFILGQRLTGRKLAGIIVGFGGVLTVATHGDPLSLTFSNIPGAALAVGSSVVWALFWLYNVKDPRDEVLKLFVNFCFGTVFVGLFALVGGAEITLDAMGLLGALYIGAFEMGITYVFWLKALSLSRSTAQVSNLVFLSPFLSLFFISRIVGEVIRPSTLLGLALIVAGILIQGRQKVVD